MWVSEVSYEPLDKQVVYKAIERILELENYNGEDYYMFLINASLICFSRDLNGNDVYIIRKALNVYT